MTDLPWHCTLAYALVGERLDLGVQSQPDAGVLAGRLAELGWDAAAVRAHATATRASREPWPHHVDAEWRAGMGPAQWLAALGRARSTLGVHVLDERPPSARIRLDADERRLLADAPPHYGQ